MREASEARPYHYVGSGLGNVYLVGITYHVCKNCGGAAADIPALPELLTAIARALVKKDSGLTGEELRFLRKRLKLSGIEFSSMIGISAETLSRFENGRCAIQPNIDKLVRLIYASIARDRLVNLEAIAKWSAELRTISGGERIIATRDANDQWIAVAA